jgi:hypothetical protein
MVGGFPNARSGIKDIKVECAKSATTGVQKAKDCITLMQTGLNFVENQLRTPAKSSGP